MNKFGELSKREITAAMLVEDVIKRGIVLKAYDGLRHKQTTVGPYQTAVPSTTKFIILGAYDEECRTAYEASELFVARVGSTRAREAALKAR